MDLARAYELIAGLADGINPLTGEILPSSSVCNQAEIVRALHAALNALSRKIDSRPMPANAGKPWGREDDEKLASMYDAGKSKKELCTYFQRTDGAIAARLVRIGKIQERSAYRANVR